MSDLSWMRPLLAELCGLRFIDEAGVIIIHPRVCCGCDYGCEFRPDEDVAQAVRCWESLLKGGAYCCADIRKPICEGWEIVLRRIDHNEDHDKPFVCVGGNGSTRTLPETLCLAVASALGWETPRE